MKRKQSNSHFSLAHVNPVTIIKKEINNMTKTIKINNDKVGNTCISNNWYTKGNNKEYTNLLYTLCEKENNTDDDINEVVEDIFNHSDITKIAQEYGTSEIEVKNNIAYYIYNDCLLIYIEY